MRVSAGHPKNVSDQQLTVSCCAAADTEGAIHGVVPQSPLRRRGAQPLLPLVYGHLDAALLATSGRPSWQPLASDRGAFFYRNHPPLMNVCCLDM